MIDLSETAGIYLYPGFTDMRCGIRSLTIKVAASFAPEKYKKSLFVFCGRNKHSIKILEIEDDGTWLYQKRFHDGRFRWPKEGGKPDDQPYETSAPMASGRAQHCPEGREQGNR